MTKKKTLVLSLSLIIFFSLSLFLSVNFKAENITGFQIIYIALFTLIAFSHIFIITKIDPVLQKKINKKHLIVLARIIILVFVGTLIYLYEYASQFLGQNRIMSLGLFIMLIPTITVFVGMVLLVDQDK